MFWPSTYPASRSCLGVLVLESLDAAEIPDAPDFGRLLSVRRERPNRCGTEESHELTPSHAEHSFFPVSGCHLSWLPAGDGAVAGGLSGSACHKAADRSLGPELS